MKVVLLPGLDGTGILFKPFIEALPRDIETLIVSYPSDLKLSYIELVDFVMSQLPEEKFILIGESFSGPIAYQIALRAPENLKSVIFVATFLSNPRRVLLNVFYLLPIKFMLAMTMPGVILKFLFFGLNANKQIIGLFKQSIKSVLPNIISFRLKEIIKLQKIDHACKIRASYIQATNDKLVPKRCAKDFKENFSEITVFQVTGPHFILQAAPIVCAEIVVNEIRQL